MKEYGLHLTYDGELFVYGDSGPDDSERIIILATEQNILLLKNNKIWFGDGTFSIRPGLFYQVYTLNVIERGKNLPMCYVLLPDKRESTYSKMFGLLLVSYTEKQHPVNLPRF